MELPEPVSQPELRPPASSPGGTEPSGLAKPSLISQSSTYPDLPSPMVERDPLISLLHSSFSSSRKAIIVRAPSGAGKTLLLAQFVAAFPDQCLSFFLGQDVWSCRPERFVLDIVQQMRQMLGQAPLPANIPYDRARQDFAARLGDISRMSRINDREVYFVIDGLDLARRHDLNETIQDILPVDNRGKVYLLASATRPDDIAVPGANWSVLDIPFGFSPAEIEHYLSDLRLSSRLLKNPMFERAGA